MYFDEEKTFFQRESDQKSELEEAIKRTEEKTIEHVDFILKTTNQISLNKITSILGFSDEYGMRSVSNRTVDRSTCP